MTEELITDISLGADPEVFVIDAAGGFVPSIDLVGGTKFAPRPLDIEGFAVQEDNVLLEYNIPPSATRKAFVENIHLGLKLAKGVLPVGYDVKIQPSAFFEDRQLSDYRAFEFGCEPDLNAWNKGEYNPKPKVPTNGLRTAGGHVHVGYKVVPEVAIAANITKEQIDMAIIQWMDIFLAVPAMLLDKDYTRRELYGRAGAYRHKEYGVEHRTLSSYWLGSEKMTGWVFDQTQKAIDKVKNKQLPDRKDRALVISAINLQNKKTLDLLMRKYEIELV